MALSPADFYSYSRATGAPIPEDPEERARMATEVLEYRRNQLKAPRQEQQQGPDPLSVGLGIGIALAGGVGGAYGLNKLLRGPKRSANAGVRQADLGSFVEEASSNVRRAQEQGVPTVVPKQSEPQPSKQPVVSTQPVEPDPWSSAGITEARTKPTPWSVVDQPPTESQPKLLAPDFASKYIDELGEELELKRQARAVQQVEAQEKAQAKNILAEMRREEETKKFTPRFYIEDTGAVAPVEDLTSKQQQELPEVIDQKINAVESGEDQFTGRQILDLQRDTDTTADRLPVNDQINTQEIAAQEFLNKEINASPQIDLDKNYTYQDLVKEGLPDFEINARMQAYATTGDKALLNPNINSKTLGHSEFLKVLGVRNASINNKMQLLDGELVNPEGDVRMSAFAQQQPYIGEKTTDTESRPYEPVSQGMTGLAGGVSTAPASYKLNEQYEKAIQNFRGEWDRNVRENINRMASGQGDYSDIVIPARAERLVDADDLDIPVRIETDSEGKVLSRTLYRDILDPEIVQQIETGDKVKLDVPFMVNKGRAYLDYRRNPTLANRATAKDYQRTGRALVQKYQSIVAPYEGSKYIPEIQEGRFFESGETGVTPQRGKGSQRGKLVGGIVEEPLSETLVPLKYQFVAKEGRVQTQTMGYTSGSALMPIDTLDDLNQLGPLLDTQGNVITVSPAQQRQFVMTQPMSVRRVTPVLQTDEQGNQRQRMVQRVARKTGKPFSAPLVQLEDVIVNAPLQVLNAKTGEEISGAAQISRSNLNQLLDQFEGQIRSTGGTVNYQQLASDLDDYLVNTQNIKLPVLSSNTAFNFIEDLRGRPSSRATTTMYATTGDLGDIYPIAADQIEDFIARNKLPALGVRKAGQTRFASTTLPRQMVGAPTLNIQEAPKGTLTGIAAEDEDLLQQLRDVRGSILDDSELGYTGYRSVELGSSRSPSLLQRKLESAKSGISAEMQQMRSQAEAIKGENWKKQFPNLFPPQEEALPTGNIETAMSQLLAQAGRRSGKRRNR